MFKELKLIDKDGFDVNAINKHIEQNFDDKSWKNVYRAVSEECTRRLKPRMSEIQKKLEAAPYNIKKGECDVQFMAYVTCINLESFLVRIFRFLLI